jgi:hypothetical protein
MIRNNTNSAKNTGRVAVDVRGFTGETKYEFRRLNSKWQINCPEIQDRKHTNKKASVILPPSPKVIDENKSFNRTEESNIMPIPMRRIQQANAMFDPNNSSPASEFMNVLKLRMSVYYEQDVNMFV